MSSYLYCDKCGVGMPSPEELETVTILKFLLSGDYGIYCSSCSEVNQHYSARDMCYELANRIDRGIKS